jgi:hypothetical protein
MTLFSRRRKDKKGHNDNNDARASEPTAFNARQERGFRKGKLVKGTKMFPPDIKPLDETERFRSLSFPQPELRIRRPSIIQTQLQLTKTDPRLPLSVKRCVLSSPPLRRTLLSKHNPALVDTRHPTSCCCSSSSFANPGIQANEFLASGIH